MRNKFLNFKKNSDNSCNNKDVGGLWTIHEESSEKEKASYEESLEFSELIMWKEKEIENLTKELEDERSRKNAEWESLDQNWE